MSDLKDNLKKYLLVKYTQTRIKEYNKRISKTIPWILRKGLMNNIETHCNVLLNSLLNNQAKQKLRQNKYIVESILKFNIERSETVIKSKKRIKNIKSFMQLNSFIIFDEITKGFAAHKKKKVIDFNIRTQLLLAQEKINSASDLEDILNECIGANNDCDNSQ